MVTYITRRILLMIPTLIGITLLVFMMIALSPGGIGAAMRQSGGALQSSSSAAVQEAKLDDRYGLDDPAIVQYFRWLGRVSPIKFGTRDQVAPAGDLIRLPRRIKEPALWRWHAETLPKEPPPPPPDPTLTDEQLIAQYAAASRAFDEARGRFVEANANLKDAIKEYGTEVGLANVATSDGKVRLSAFRNHEPDRSARAWPEVERRAAETIEIYIAALDARATLVTAFNTRPYPQAGIGVPGIPISIAAPDFGTAFSRGRPVIDLIAEHLPVTLTLNLIAFPIIYMVAIPGGLLAAVNRGRPADTVLGGLFVGLYSFPTVLAGVLSVGFLASANYAGAFPAAGLSDITSGQYAFLPRTVEGEFQPGWVLDRLHHLVLPVLCLVYGGFAVLSKQTRASMLDNFSADYVRTAKAKGVSSRDVILRHVFRNSLLPLITMFVTLFPAMLAGSVVVERIFQIPGMGRLLLDAIALRDRELLLANTVMIACVNLLALLLADILYALADPRVSFE